MLLADVQQAYQITHIENAPSRRTTSLPGNTYRKWGNQNRLPSGNGMHSRT